MLVGFLSSWVKNLSLVIVVVTILEMLLPNNKTKKYIKMVMGVYILFNIIYPFAEKSQAISIDNICLEDFDKTSSNIINKNDKEELNQSSMDKRLNEIYVEELEKDIKKKIEDKGYIVSKCTVNAKIVNYQDNTGIHKIVINVKKNNQSSENKIDEKIEDSIVTEVEKIKKVQIRPEEENFDLNNNVSNTKITNITKADIQNIKSFLIEEYGVKGECLEIN